MGKRRDRNGAYQQFLGTFDLGGRSVTGDLTLQGSNTLLNLHHPEFLPPLEAGACVYGTTFAGDSLTLINCHSPGVGSTRFAGGNSTYHAQIFPHYVALGRGIIDPSQPSVRAIHFTSTDLPTLFYDFDAFGKVIDAKPIIEAVLQERRDLRPVESGEQPLVCYFAGRDRIADVQTAVGRVTVRHRPNYNLGGPSGAYIKNRVVISIEPDAPVLFEDAVDRMYAIANFLSVTAGRKQGIYHVQIEATDAAAQKSSMLVVHPSFPWKAGKINDQHAPHPADVPLDPIHHAPEFSAVLTDWIRRHKAWQAARVRYLDCLSKGNHYNTERLVAAANMFDILPPEAVPAPTRLADDLAATKAACEELFRKHPEGVDRNGALSALGRIGKPSLPKKVAHRVAIVATRLGATFPDLQFVATIAVRCRNFFVHGSDEIDYPKLEHLVPFLTNALEFIFAASDLIDAGWDAQRWDSQGHSWGHNLARFRWGYQASLAELRRAALIASG
jgi:ApeA N-terminal domain 1